MDLVSFGSTFLELVFGHIPKLPAPGEELFTEEFAVSCGGAITVVDAAARSGVHAGLCTRLGPYLASRVVEAHCERRRIDLSPSIRVEEAAGGITIVFNFDGDRAFVTHLPTPPGDRPEPERWRQVLRRERPKWCYLHARGDAVPEAVTACIRLADVFVPNEAELCRLAGEPDLEAAIAAVAPFCPRLVVKRGPAGAVVVEQGRSRQVSEGVQDVEVRDRTGAGDAFAGAMIAALVRDAALEEAVAAGNAAGSDAVGRLGAVGEVEGDVLYKREVGLS